MPLGLVSYITQMTCAAARPGAMLQHFPARLLACSLRRTGAALCHAQKLVTSAQAQQQPTQQAPPAVTQQSQHLTVVAANPAATQLLAHFFACELHPSDCYLLYGSVGAGKSYFRCAEGRALPMRPSSENNGCGDLFGRRTGNPRVPQHTLPTFSKRTAKCCFPFLCRGLSPWNPSSFAPPHSLPPACALASAPPQPGIHSCRSRR